MTDWTERSDTDEIDAFHEWLRETAEREGRPPEDVLRQVMSTYWILTELTELMEETEFEGMFEGEVDHNRASDGGSDDHRAIVDVIESIAKMHGPQEPQRTDPGGSIDPGLIQLIEAIRGGDESSGDGRGVDVDAKYQLAKLRDEIQDLSSDLDTVETRTAGLEKELEDVRSDQRSKSKRLERRMTRVEDELGRTPDAQDLEELRELMSEHRAELVDRLVGTEERFEDAYSAIKQILTHLLDASDTSEERMNVLVELLESEIDSLAMAHAERERLSEIKASAARQGVTRPICDGCDEPIELALLEEPQCPSCNRPLEGITTEQKFLRTKHFAKTRAPRKDDELSSELVEQFRRHVGELADMENEELEAGLALEE